MSKMIQILAPRFVAAVIFDEKDIVKETAPILFYMNNWSLDRVKSYCNSKNWEIKEVLWT